jgi:hypothetical protein
VRGRTVNFVTLKYFIIENYSNHSAVANVGPIGRPSCVFWFALIHLFYLWQDVGQAVLESYSRILESLAFTVLSRIEDVLHADCQTQNPSQGRRSGVRNSVPKPDKCPTPPREEVDKIGAETPCSMTLSDFMGWSGDQGESDPNKKDPLAVSDDSDKDIDSGKLQKLPLISTDKKLSYVENIGGMRSPTSRH